ncbi:transferase [Streptomyces nigra]|uniref:transferase n=1 Tax=Streptomyces nigra TaxID=1827580 RepID=UPI000D526E1F|nr:transferase [Streptomyces nigra]AWE48663.1 transferase [Streptomyces nigra]
MNTQSAPTAPPAIACTADADGRITFHVVPPDPAAFPSPRLLLRLRPRKGQPEESLRELDLTVGGDGRLTAVLDPLPDLPEGRWDLYLLPEPDGERVRSRPGLRDLRALVAGHLRDRPAPVAVRIPYVTKDGYLALRTWLRDAHAEVAGIDVTDRSTTVRARLHGASLTEGGCVLLRLRGGKGVERTVAPQPGTDGRDLAFTVDHADLLAEGGTGDRVWDVFVRPGAGDDTAVIRAGRLLDDVADRKEIFVYPAATAGEFAVRPYYTVDNDLAVEVLRRT